MTWLRTKLGGLLNAKLVVQIVVDTEGFGTGAVRAVFAETVDGRKVALDHVNPLAASRGENVDYVLAKTISDMGRGLPRE
jgi:hypothetical protein